MKPLYSAEANKLKRGNPMTNDLKESLPPSAPVNTPGSQTEAAEARCRWESDPKIRDASNELSQNLATTAQNLGRFALPLGPGVLGTQHTATCFPPFPPELETRCQEGSSPIKVPKLDSNLEGSVDSKLPQAETALSESFHPISELSVGSSSLAPLIVGSPRSMVTDAPADVAMGEASEKVGDAEPEAPKRVLQPEIGTPRVSAAALVPSFFPATPETGKAAGLETAVECGAFPNERLPVVSDLAEPGILPVNSDLAEPGIFAGAAFATRDEPENKAASPTPERTLANAEPSVFDTLCAGAGALLSGKYIFQCLSLTFIIS
jgi:hypothetical protein